MDVESTASPSRIKSLDDKGVELCTCTQSTVLAVTVHGDILVKARHHQCLCDRSTWLLQCVDFQLIFRFCRHGVPRKELQRGQAMPIESRLLSRGRRLRPRCGRTHSITQHVLTSTDQHSTLQDVESQKN